jgi:predicted transcriptional regulator
MTDTIAAIVSHSHEKIPDNTKIEIVPKYDDSTNKINPKDLKLLDTIARRYSSKIVGEPKNIKTLVCCFVSKDLPKEYRLSTIIANNSSTGKSYMLNNVLAPFHDDLVDYTDFTEAHFKRTQKFVDGKIIKLEQLERTNENQQLSMQRLKHLLSEGRLKFGVVDKSEKGENQARDFEIVGFPIFVTTVTKFEIDSETANRVFMMQLDESENQTEKIIEHTLNKYSKLGVNESWEQDKEELEQFFKKLKDMAHHVDGISIPFANKLKSIIPKNLEIRRDLTKILNLTCVIAFIHGLNRPYILDKNGKNFIKDQYGNTENEPTYRIIAKPEDFIEALEIGGQTIRQTINKSSLKMMEIQALLKKLYNEKIGKVEQAVTVKEIMKPSNLSENRAREYLNELVDKGFAIKDDNQREHKYSPTDRKFSDLNPESIIFSEAEFQSWIKTEVEPYGDRYSLVGSWNSDSDTQRNQITNETNQKDTTVGVSCDNHNSVSTTNEEEKK